MTRPPLASDAMRAPALLLTLLVASSTATAEEPETMLHMQEYEFLPTTIEVVAGAFVTAMNFGDIAHTVTSVEPRLFDVREIPPGGEERPFLAPTTPGTYRFYCAYHATPDTEPGEGMAGLLLVTPGATPPPRHETPTPHWLLLVAIPLARLIARRG